MKSNKIEAADAEAICEAVNRPHMRFVLIKTQAQPTMLSLHRARVGLVKLRTTLANQIRGLLNEFGIVLPRGIRLLGKRAIEALSNRAVISVAATRPEMADSWVMKLSRRRHKNIATVALAAKSARTAWALLVRNQVYEVSHVPMRSGVAV